ncbi:MAG TPA: hypothetical protein VFG45_10635 [Candidatus Nitrosocosmicus sp.]|nr:hypothetical protein [Candidatus Nitrosocosmicus sp.]
MQFVFTLLSVDTCNNSRGSFWSDLEFENISIGIEHNLKKVFVSYHLLDKNTSLISFRSDDGFPISILIESFLVFDIQCVHKIKNKIRVPIESGCKWKLLGGMSEGAFKSNGGLDTRYSDIFHDSNCAVYYPPRGGFDKTIDTKKITIQLSVYPFVLNHQNGNPPSSDEVGSIGTINTLFINSPVVRNYFLEITLKRMGGFLNRNSYEVKLECKSIHDGFDSQNQQAEEVVMGTALPECDENDCHTYSKLLPDKNLLYSTFNTEEQSCILCDLKLYLRYWRWMFQEKLKIDLSYSRFFTSEYVSLTRILYERVKSLDICGNNKKNVAIFDIRNKDNLTFKLRLSECLLPKILETVWNTTAGSFPCGRIGNSVVFQTPSEKELRKSPITISISEIIRHDDAYHPKAALIDQRRIILLRRMVFGG